ncbi:multicopper oxidase domain-containing protein, partial [Azotobacter chroococcum]|nr:multicopper oxidase domain-containing protein [Azotobacter chroococcum]
ANMRGTWRDTLFVQDDHLITIRSRYRRYTGDFVLHCHILDHEDQGMMQNVRISQTGSGEDEDSGHQH